MEASVDTLEAKFAKTESDIDCLSRKLDTQFEKNGDADCSPAEMFRKLAEVKKDYATIIKEVKELQQAEKEAMDYFKAELMASCQALSQLQLQTGVTSESDPEVRTVENLLGISNLMGGETEVEQSTATDGAVSASDKAAQESDAAAACATPVVEPHIRRAQSKDFIEITESELDSVSSLIRGRVKLYELNHTYRVLWNYFKEENNVDPLSVKDMYKMGLKVTGQTGEAKLRILKSLKLIDMSRNGEVQLL